MEEAQCIYCHGDKTLSGEHYLPTCLGKFYGFEQLRNKICMDCNNKLGKLDEQFCRCGPEAFFRRVLGIKGRKHHKEINPFYRNSAGAQLITIESKHPVFDCMIFCEIQEGGESAFPARQIIVRDHRNKYHSVLLTDKIMATKNLSNEFKEKGFDVQEVVECHGTEEERKSVQKICNSMNTSFSSDKYYFEPSKTQFTTTFIVNNDYFRAIAKIAFHYCLKQFSQFTGFESEFKMIKRFIMEGDVADSFIKEKPGSFINGLGPRVTVDKWSHFLVAEKNERDIVVKLHFFVGPRMAPNRYYEVRIGNNPGRIIFPQSVGHHFLYFKKTDEKGFHGLVEPLTVVSKKLLP